MVNSKWVHAISIDELWRIEQQARNKQVFVHTMIGLKWYKQTIYELIWGIVGCVFYMQKMEQHLHNFWEQSKDKNEE